MSQSPFSGVWVPALTPFRADLSVDRDAFVGHCRWLLDEGADGLAVFGTTSEANSLSLDERMTLLDDLIRAGLPPEKLMPGTGCCALPDTVRLSRHAAERGCGAVLMLPPFYYKGVSDDGLFNAFSWAVDRLASDDLKIFLYHIPSLSQVPISLTLVGRLLEAYPGRIAGLKDSGGDWSFTSEVLNRFPDLTVFAGSERFLLNTLRHGGAGCITASGNVNPSGIRLVYEQWRDATPGVEASQQGVDRIRDALEKFQMIPALKVLCARHYNHHGWTRVRPPLTELPRSGQDVLFRSMEALAFTMAFNRRCIEPRE